MPSTYYMTKLLWAWSHCWTESEPPQIFQAIVFPGTSWANHSSDIERLDVFHSSYNISHMGKIEPFLPVGVETSETKGKNQPTALPLSHWLGRGTCWWGSRIPCYAELHASIDSHRTRSVCCFNTVDCQWQMPANRAKVLQWNQTASSWSTSCTWRTGKGRDCCCTCQLAPDLT